MQIHLNCIFILIMKVVIIVVFMECHHFVKQTWDAHVIVDP